MILDDYLNLIPSENRQKPDFLAAITTFIQPFIDEQSTLNGMSDKFDIDTAEGQQLDVLGQWVGIGRRVFVPVYGDVLLADEQYRQILYAKIVRNSWDGTIADAYTIFDIVFGAPYKIIIIDNQDMSMLFGIFRTDAMPIDPLMQALFSGGYFDLRPSGVLITGYITGDLPLFGLDYDDSFISGFDVGHLVEYI